MLESAVYFGLSSAVSEARRLFQQWMSANIQLAPDIRVIVYSTGNITLANVFFSLFTISYYNVHLFQASSMEVGLSGISVGSATRKPMFLMNVSTTSRLWLLPMILGFYNSMFFDTKMFLFDLIFFFLEFSIRFYCMLFAWMFEFMIFFLLFADI